MKKNICMLLALSIFYGCSTPIPNSLNNIKQKTVNSIKNNIINNKKSEIKGLVSFPKTKDEELKTFSTKSRVSKNRNRFKIKADINQISENSTVSLISPDSSALNAVDRYKVIGSALSNPDGSFALSFGTSSFDPEVNKVYILEASKRIGTSGNNIMTIRTFVRWNGDIWESIVTSGMVINEYTTAISIIQNYNSTNISPESTFNKISYVDDTPTISNITGTTVNDIKKVANFVLLSIYQLKDPYSVIKFSGSDYSLEQISSLQKFVETGKCEGCKFSQSDMVNYDFTNKDLAYADFSGLNLDQINFSGSILYKANLSNTYTYNSTLFTDSDLTGINFSGSHEYSTHLADISLDNADFSGAIIDHSTFEYLDITNAKFKNTTLTKSIFSNNNLSGSNFTGANFTGGDYSDSDFTDSFFSNSGLYSVFYNCDFDYSTFTNSDFTRSKFSYSDFGSSTFENINLNFTTFPNTSLDKVDLTNQSLSGVSLRGAILKNRDLSGINLFGSDLSYADLSNVNLENAITTYTKFDNSIFLNTKMPDGSIKNTNPLSNKVVFSKSNNIYLLDQDTKDLVQITNNSFENSNPILAKDTGKIIYVQKNTSGTHDIYMVNLDGTGLTNLTSDLSTKDNSEPVLTTDGTKIIFTSTENGLSNIYSMNIDGTNKTDLTNTSNKVNKSPDTFGNKIVYSSDNEIYEMDLDGTNPLQITSNISTGYSNSILPKFSPDGTKIAFLSDTNKDNNNGNNIYHIWVANSENTNVSLDAVRLTTSVFVPTLYSTYRIYNGVINYLWSTKTNIAFTSYNIDTNFQDIFTVNFDDKSLKRHVVYGTSDSYLMGLLNSSIDSAVSVNRFGGTIYYVSDNKVYSYDIDFDVNQEILGN